MRWRAAAVSANSSGPPLGSRVRLPERVEGVTFCDNTAQMTRPASRNSRSSGLEVCYGPSVRAQKDCRERLIDTTLALCISGGYEATTIDQIAAAAKITPPEFAEHFATKDAAIMSVVDDLVQATAAALGHVDAAAGP